MSPLIEAREPKADFKRYAADYARDGVVVIRNALSEDELKWIDRAFEHKLADPRAALEKMFVKDQAVTLQALGYSLEDPVFQDVMNNTSVADVAGGVFGGGPVWYMGEQLWLKHGGHARRTTWHQDSVYLPFDGPKTAVVWIPLQSLPAESVLEVVRGSHTGPGYNGTTGEDDEVMPMYDDWPAPVIPDIEAERNKWDIFCTAMDRGDVLVFHTNALHGGAPTFPGQTRRSMSFRLAGDDVVYTPRPPMKNMKMTREDVTDFIERQQGARFLRAFDCLKPGDRISSSPGFDQVRR
jgi:ectoine hydroxylase-related dioxygenase (phytanoyl-CoA dioxygenase family)